MSVHTSVDINFQRSIYLKIRILILHLGTIRLVNVPFKTNVWLELLQIYLCLQDCLIPISPLLQRCCKLN